MPHVQVHVARIDIGTSSGNIFSYSEIPELNDNSGQLPCQILPIARIVIQTPPGYVLENVAGASPYGDSGEASMVFDPVETAKGETGKVYMRAARLVDRMRSGEPGFVQVPGVGP